MWTIPSFDVKPFAYYAPLVDELDLICLTVTDAGASEQRSVMLERKKIVTKHIQF